MNLLLDTHAFLCVIGDKDRLSTPAAKALSDPQNQAYLSAASGCEIAIKAGLGKLKIPHSTALDRFILEHMTIANIESLPVTLRHALHVHHLPDHHNDPFDRLLIAQSISEKLILITADPLIKKYPVKTLW